MNAKALLRSTLCSAAVAVLVSACGGGGAGGSGSITSGGGVTSGGSVTADSFPVITRQAAASQGDNITGSVNATDSTCTVQNGNQFATRQDVYMREGANGPRLPEGNYWVRVTSPRPNGDESLLGAADKQVYVTSGGALQLNPTTSGCVQVWSVVKKSSDGSTGFDYTPNTGGVYKLWISKDANFAANLSRTDNFMIRENAPPPPPTTGSITIKKFYDANLDGLDNDTLPVAGWLMQVLREGYASLITATDVAGQVVFGNLSLADYLATERKPNEVGASLPYSWYATNAYDTSAPQLWDVVSDTYTLNKFPIVLTSTARDKTVAFGNVCVGPAEGGYAGKTLGYWSNNNGRNDIDTYNAANPSNTAYRQLGDLHLTDQSGTYLTYVNGTRDTTRDFSTHTAFRTWLLAGNAQNMAYMLSVQLAAMKLNVLTGKVDGNAWLRADGVPDLGLVTKKLNFMKVNDLITVADKLLELAPLTVANLLPGMTERERQERTKDALDNGNNNRGFLQSTPANCPLTFPN